VPQHYFEMQDGVIHVYPNKNCKLMKNKFLNFEVTLVARFFMHVCLLLAANEELFPVADATTFFTDLHQILRVIAAGNIRTLCHHRLNLLEQVNTCLN